MTTQNHITETLLFVKSLKFYIHNVYGKRNSVTQEEYIKNIIYIRFANHFIKIHVKTEVDVT